MNINCLIVPTGIGASIGGFAGDANPVARKLAKVSDYLITHPNVVNGAALTNIVENVLVVEGYLLDQFFLNKIALRPDLEHKIGVVVDSDISEIDKQITTNVVNAARAFYGLEVLDIIWTKEAIGAEVQSPESMHEADTTKALDECKIANLETLFEGCRTAIAQGATALAVMAKIIDPPETEESLAYTEGKGYDPIGLLEAKISHAVTKEFLIPAAHAPILDPPLYKTIIEEGIVHPKASAEFIGLSFLPSVMQCLNKSAVIIPLDTALANKQARNAGIDKQVRTKASELAVKDIYIEDLSKLIVPYDSCDAIPMHQAAKHGIELVSVKENTTILNATAESLELKHKLVTSYNDLLIRASLIN